MFNILRVCARGDTVSAGAVVQFDKFVIYNVDVRLGHITVVYTIQIYIFFFIELIFYTYGEWTIKEKIPKKTRTLINY